ncbi:MAG: hypothetical protein C4278_00830 [Patescibacteria group bacterium]
MKSLLLKLKNNKFLFQNTFWFYLSEFVSKASRFFVFIIIARILGREEFGVFNYVLALLSLFFLFSDFGLGDILIRDFQQKENKEKIIKETFTLKFYLNIVIFLISFLGLFFLKDFSKLFLLYLILGLYFIFNNLRYHFNSLFLTSFKAFNIFILNLVEGFLLIFSLLIFSLFFKSALAIGLGYLFSAFLIFSFSYFVYQKNFKFKLKEKINQINIFYYFKNGLPLVFFGLLGYVFFTTDQIIIGHFRSFSELGIYSVASKIILSLVPIGALLSSAIFPYISRKIYNYQEIKKYFFIFIYLELILAFLTVVFCYLFSPFLIGFAFGKEFLDSLPLIYILIWILVFMFPVQFLDKLLFSYNKQWLDFWLTLIPAILNLILNIYLVPIYGVYGAIFSSIVSQILNFVLTFSASYYVIEKYSKNLV